MIAHAPAAAITPTISVRHLWHRYGAADVLRDVSFEVYPGEIYGFIGPNGSGKTTTIRVMTTLLEPMAGRVEIAGFDVSIDPDEVRRRIGYMPDHAGVYEHLTLREYLEFFADAFHVESREAVDTVLELCDLHAMEGRVVAEVSKGIKQRLQLARVLLHDPEVLVLDEPASDLDPRARIEFKDLLLELRGLGKTIFLSSHILTELSDLCTSIGILERGRLVVTGPIHEIAARFEHARSGAPGPGAWRGHPHAPRYAVPTASPGHAGLPMPASPAAPPAPAASHAAPAHAPSPEARDAEPLAGAGPQSTSGGERRLKIRLLSDPAVAAQLLRGGLGLERVGAQGGTLLVGHAAGDRGTAQIVSHLVKNGVPVIGVEHDRTELERIFLEATRGTGP